MFEYFRGVGIAAGMPENQALAFAGCCMACKKFGCQYGERMTVMMRDLLSQYPENPHAKGIMKKLDAPWSDFHEPDFRGPPPPPRSNRSRQAYNDRSRNNDRRQRNQRYDNRPPNRRKQRRKRWREPESNTVGRVGSKRGRTSPRPPKMAREPKRQATGSPVKTSIPKFKSDK
jgi:hypothetical protein